jgi:FMN phosphatase YigB (HAD superfamily)
VDWLPHIDTVLFDWGGTLCETSREEDIFARCTGGAFARARDLGVRIGEAQLPSFVAFFMDARNRANEDPQHRELDLLHLLSVWFADVGHPSVPFETIAAVSDAFWTGWVGCLEPIGDIVGLLDELKRARFRVGLVSNTATPPQWCRQEVRRLGFAPHFDSLTFSSEVGRRKPHPAIYQDALAKIADGAPADPTRILFVGDKLIPDVAGPQRMGMRAAHVRPQGAADDDPGIRPDLTIQFATDLRALLCPKK